MQVFRCNGRGGFRPLRALMMLVPAMALTSGCTGEANHLGNPLLWPFQAASTGVQNAAYNARRGEVEQFVMQNHPALVADIRAGGGATLTRAFDIAGVPENVRAAHIWQLRSDLAIYESSPQALVVAIMVVS